ncbi:MAG TPA: citrate/2-methylcitrate synthase [Acidimicrobiales bacterium]|nr:citrate/2-methylcitrate synthase [Acidimicrobiales bacterium]
MSADRWMTSEAAAARLGVKQQTLYAYVSRGLVGSEPVPGTRRSRFLRSDVERLAARQRAGGRSGGLEVVVETDLTLLDPAGALYYRGWNVEDAVAAGASFEEVAGWLWSGDRSPAPFDAPPAMLAAARRVAGALADQPLMDRMRAAIAAARHTDPLRDDRRPAAVGMTGRALIAALVAALPPAARSGTAPAGAPVARRLWSRLSPVRPRPELVRVLDAALVLLADHELAASTLAARVTASTWADPYLVVEAGLAALGGPLHGGASSGARRLIREVASGAASAPEAIGNRLRDGQRIPGFGHRIYRDRDPRADVLLRALSGTGRRLDAEDAIRATMHERGLPFPNVDFAIASLAERHDMVDEAGEIIFAVARTAGWLAHAAEEYPHRLRFRPRATYTGPPPGTVTGS